MQRVDLSIWAHGSKEVPEGQKTDGNSIQNILQAFLNNSPLRAQRRADDHPSFMVEIAQNDLHTLSDFS